MPKLREPVCVNCIHHRSGDAIQKLRASLFEEGKKVTKHPDALAHWCAGHIDQVTGRQRYALCHETRDYTDWCGKDGAWFEQREGE